MKRTILHLLVTLLCASLLAGCVTRKEHDRLMAEAARRLSATQQAAANEKAAADARIADLTSRIAQLEQQLMAKDEELTRAQNLLAKLRGQLDDANALTARLSGALKKAGKNVDALLAQKGNLNQSLKNAKKRLEQLRKAQAASEKRAQLFRSLILKFKKLIDAGDLKIVMRDGRMVLQMRNDVLFDSGRTTIKQAGKDALQEVAGVLMTIKGRKFQVVGHTDNDPISSPRYPSNWELSTARAVAVVRYLIEEGVDTGMLSAGGYGPFDPVASNETPQGKAKNRRIEIVLQPDLSELVSMPTKE
ncbi:MAG: OmpA family protein [Polyangiaceae bacterium]